jgi:hypothetical protein
MADLRRSHHSREPMSPIDPKTPDASVRYEEARTYNIAPCPLRARRVRPALTEVGSS